MNIVDQETSKHDPNDLGCECKECLVIYPEEIKQRRIETKRKITDEDCPFCSSKLTHEKTEVGEFAFCKQCDQVIEVISYS